MNVLLVAVLVLYLVSTFHAIITITVEQLRDRITTWLRALVAIGFGIHSTEIILEWVQQGHFPIVSIKEVCSIIAWALAAYYLFFLPRKKARAMPVILLSCAFLLTLLSLLIPPKEISNALSSAITASHFTQIIFPLHVTMLAFSYAAFIVTVVAGIMYIVQERDLKTKNFGASFQWLPALTTCDEISYRSLTIGFVLLTLGILTGMMWGSQHDGRLWHNDPKEVLALVTWIVYLAILHYRITAGWRGKRVAWLAVGGFVAVLITFFGARVMGGYHVFG